MSGKRGTAGGSARGVLPKMFTLPRDWQAGKLASWQTTQLLLNLQSALRVDNGAGEAEGEGKREDSRSRRWLEV